MTNTTIHQGRLGKTIKVRANAVYADVFLWDVQTPHTDTRVYDNGTLLNILKAPKETRTDKLKAWYVCFHNTYITPYTEKPLTAILSVYTADLSSKEDCVRLTVYYYVSGDTHIKCNYIVIRRRKT